MIGETRLLEIEEKLKDAIMSAFDVDEAREIIRLAKLGLLVDTQFNSIVKSFQESRSLLNNDNDDGDYDPAA